MNIAGNFDTKSKEIKIIKDYLDAQNIEYQKIEEYHNQDDADVLVVLDNNKSFTIEIKEEGFNRIERYNDLGIDLISNCVFSDDSKSHLWKGTPKSPSQFTDFINDLNIESPRFKWGKIKYSKADIWLFFSQKNNEILFLDLYDGKKIVSDDFYKYLSENCKFTVNNKPSNQLSYFDRHHSAVFYIHRSDQKLNSLKIDIKEFIDKL